MAKMYKLPCRYRQTFLPLSKRSLLLARSFSNFSNSESLLSDEIHCAEASMPSRIHDSQNLRDRSRLFLGHFLFAPNFCSEHHCDINSLCRTGEFFPPIFADIICQFQLNLG